MTEQEWLTAAEPRRLIDFALDAGTHRRLRLLACACCRRAWNAFVEPFTVRVVVAAEAFADGDIGVNDLVRVHEAALRQGTSARHDAEQTGLGYLARVAEAAAHAADPRARNGAELALREAALAAADVSLNDFVRGRLIEPPEYAVEQAAQADLVRDIFGNPFQSVGIELEWLTETVLALARGIYADRAFDRMPILADALQDAGCDDEELLAHCRGAKEHVRGCWVVDLLLGKV